MDGWVENHAMASQPDAPSQCPACGSTKLAAILYGLPDFSPELRRKLDDGIVVLGGCCIFGNDPRWQCTECWHKWGAIELPDPSPRG